MASAVTSNAQTIPTPKNIILELGGAVVERGRGDANEMAAYELTIETFTLTPGDCLGVIGPSGSGKSTFLDFLALLIWPKTLTRFVLWDQAGQSLEVARALMDRRADRLSALRAGMIGYVLQDGGLLPYLSVLGNATLAARLAGLEAHDVRPRIDHLADVLGIAHLVDRVPARLSGGERQRAAILRAMAVGPRVLLADEPTAALDEETGETVMAALQNAASEASAALVCVSHDRNMLERRGFRLHEVAVTQRAPDLRAAVLRPLEPAHAG